MSKDGINKLKKINYEIYSFLHLHIVLIDEMLFHGNHKHIRNVKNILHMDDRHWYLDTAHLINVLVYHIHSRVGFPH
jgi:hypothetical protein